MDRYSHKNNNSEVTKEIREIGRFEKVLIEKSLMQGRKEGREDGRIEERRNILETIVDNLMKSNTSMTREQAIKKAKALVI